MKKSLPVVIRFLTLCFDHIDAQIKFANKDVEVCTIWWPGDWRFGAFILPQAYRKN